jgi:signal transduction histidine kinase
VAQLIGIRTAIAIDNARLFNQAQKAIEAREHVLAVVSHDLRNPLHSLMISASAAQNLAVSREDGKPYRRHAELILRSARRMSRLIEDLLDFASIEHGKLQIVMAEEDAASIAREELDGQAPLADERGVQLIGVGIDEPVLLVCDKSRVLQVLDNLLANALQLTPKGGKIAVAVTESGSMVRFSVSDTGPGIERDQLDHLFDRYWRADRAGYPGRGLGLAISRGIVEVHGGRIWAESRVGQGSTFHVEFPRSGRAQSASG